MSTNNPKNVTGTGAFEKQVFNDTNKAIREEQEKHYMELNYLAKPTADKSIVDRSKQEISDRLDALNRRLDLIFGDHILIKGKWISPSGK